MPVSNSGRSANEYKRRIHAARVWSRVACAPLGRHRWPVRDLAAVRHEACNKRGGKRKAHSSRSHAHAQVTTTSETSMSSEVGPCARSPRNRIGPACRQPVNNTPPSRAISQRLFFAPGRGARHGLTRKALFFLRYPSLVFFHALMCCQRLASPRNSYATRVVPHGL